MIIIWRCNQPLLLVILASRKEESDVEKGILIVQRRQKIGILSYQDFFCNSLNNKKISRIGSTSLYENPNLYNYGVLYVTFFHFLTLNFHKTNSYIGHFPPIFSYQHIDLTLDGKDGSSCGITHRVPHYETWDTYQPSHRFARVLFLC